VILSTGVDVEPTTAPFFVTPHFDKAWEYGGWPKVIMALDPKQLELTYREIPADTPADEVARLMQDYPARFESETGDSFWLTRFPESDTGAGSAYERDYARWIPGNALQALLAVFVFKPESGTA
jgi:hypothetical protein